MWFRGVVAHLAKTMDHGTSYPSKFLLKEVVTFDNYSSLHR